MALQDEFTFNRTKAILYGINTMLNTIGQPDILDEEDVDVVWEAGEAYKDLIQVKREVLSSGWDANTDENYTLIPDATTRLIPIASNMLQVSGQGISTREGYVYDKNRQSVVFEDEISVNIIWDLEYNNIPQALQNYILLKAVRRFRDRIIGADAAQHNATLADEREAYMEARRAEVEYTSASMLSPSFDINRA